MANGIRIIYLRGLNKRFCSKFRVGSRVRYETLEEGRRMHRSKCCEYKNKDEYNSVNALNYSKPSFISENLMNKIQ